MLNTTNTMLKTPRELRALLRSCGFKIRRCRGNEEIWEHPHQTGLQIVLMLADLHTVHRRQRQQHTSRKAK
jgi:predicted RNA binding protein YcfA (HicA-like mRNA interferase family)